MPRPLADFIRAHQAEILLNWECAARRLPGAQNVERPALIDHVPDVLETVADLADQLASGSAPSFPRDVAERHALERLEEGFDLSQVVAELALLRDCILRLWERDQLPASQLVGVCVLNQAVDRAISESVDRYTKVRDRALQGLDKLTNAALESTNLDDLLRRLLQVLTETIPGVDTAAILLREGDRLRVRAAVGLEEEVTTGFTLGIGEGFAGLIAAQGRPHFLHAASTDPFVKTPTLAKKGVRALYGVPLTEGGQVIGVAYIGSLTAQEFSNHDKRLLVAMANRATAAIYQHVLRESSATRARQQAAVSRLGLFALETVNVQTIMQRAVEAVADTLGVELAKILELVPDGKSLVLRAGVGWEQGLVGRAIVDADPESHMGFTLEAAEPVIVYDLRTETRFKGSPILHAHCVVSGMSAIIHAPGHGGRPYGVVGAHTRVQRAFTPDDVNFLQAVANVVATAIIRRNTEEELKAAERRLSLYPEQVRLLAVLADSVPILVSYLDPHLRYRFTNKAYEEWFGRSRDDIQGKHARDVLGEAAYERLRPHIEAALAGQSVHYEQEIPYKSGARVVEATYLPDFAPNGAVAGFVAIVADITEKKGAAEAEKAARAEAERALAVVDAWLSSSLVGFGLIDSELRYVRVNDAFAVMNGIPAAEHIGRTVRDVLGKDREATAPIEAMLRRMLETGEALTGIELTAAPPPSTPDRLRSFHANYFPVRTPKGETIGIGAAVIEITDRKRMEEDLRERELRFRTLADSISQFAWMADETGWIFWYNQRWFEYTGTTLEEMKGWGWQKVHHPDHVRRVVEKIRHHFETGEVWEDTFPLRGKDGRYRWFLSRAIPIRDELGKVVRWFGTNTDVTETRLLAEVTTVLSSSLDYRQTLQKMAELAVPALADWCVVDLLEREGKANRIAVVNSDPSKIAFAKEFARKYPPDWNAPSGSTKVMRTGAPELVEEISDELLVRTARDPEQLRLLRELGLKSYILVPLIARDRTLGAIGIVSAESGIRYGKKDLEFLQEVARRAAIAIDSARLYEEAQRAVSMREEILAVVSHDLKNPLGAIQMAGAMLLRKPGTDPSSRKQIETINRSVSRMDHLIGDLLDMASIQAGRLAIERKPEDPEAVVAEAVAMHEPAAREKGVAIVHGCELQGLRLPMDRDRILQVLGNLLGNAIKFCRLGDVITVRGDRSGREARFSVSDTGPGIPESDLPHVFEPYWSAKNYAKKGTGLGLYISRGIIEAHGGTLSVESKRDEGATFRFTLPIEV